MKKLKRRCKTMWSVSPLYRKVALARKEAAAGQGRPNEEVEAEFAARRAAMIDAATPENMHPETDFGPPVGKEEL